jgi:SagB-type dehydrogenase family enzyme
VNARHPITCERVVVQKLAQNSVKLGLRPKNALHRESPLYEVFHENTKLGRWNGRVYSAWAAAFAQCRPGQTPLRGGKIYSLMDRHALPQAEAHTALERTIEARRSIRTFSGAPLGVDQLARLLFFTYGRTDRRGSFRAVPSGGALYPLELYLAALNVDGLEAGIYHYASDTHHLDVVEAGNCHAALRDVLYLKGIDIDRASAVVVVTAAFQRSTIKYCDRGYRMVLLEAGEAAQNLSLLATSMDLGACVVDGFNDDRLSELLDIDGVDEAPLLAAVVGRPTVSA